MPAAMTPIAKHTSAHQRGNTLIEALVTVTILGILTMLSSPAITSAIGFKKNADDDRQAYLNQQIGGVLLDYARTIDPTGQFPAPFTSGSIRYGIDDGTNTNLFTLMTQARIPGNQMNGTGIPNANSDYVRVYQLVSGLTQTVPLIAQSGPNVTLNYQQAAIYSTKCNRNATCNTTGGPGGIPGVSGLYQASNLSTFALTGTDYGLSMISTFALQRQMLNATVDRLYTIRDKMQMYVQGKLQQAAASDTTNWYPRPITAAPAASRVNTPDCHNDGWYALHNSDILSQIGLSSAEYGKTAWGGEIHFCPDYDIGGAKAADAAPHYAALRISNTPVSILSPANVNTNAGNVIITF